jgi:hypothetical protein
MSVLFCGVVGVMLEVNTALGALASFAARCIRWLATY